MSSLETRVRFTGSTKEDWEAPTNRRPNLIQASSIAHRVHKSNESVDDKKLWGVAATIGLTLLIVHSLAYVVVEYALFNGKSSYFGFGSFPNYFVPNEASHAAVCMTALKNSGFSLMETDKYKNWFDETSVLELSQTGTFIGPETIEEYVNFVLASQYFHVYKRMTPAIPTPIRLTEEKCSILFTTTHRVQIESKFAGNKCVDTLFGFTLHYKPKPFHVERANVFYSSDFLDKVIGEDLNTDGVRDYVCNVMESNCKDTFDLNNLTSSTCKTKYDALPAVVNGYLDGNTKGCRILHAAFASVNDKHCPHLSFIPEEDYLGHVKCQESKGRVASDLFSPFELDKINEQGYEAGFPPSLYEECEFDPDFKYESVSDTLGITDTIPLEYLNDGQFQVYAAIVAWFTVVLSGFGTEYLIWQMFLQGDWNDAIELKWRTAQFLFPLLGNTTFGLAITGNFLALPFFVATMWKLGFPETILYIFSALHNKAHSFTERTVDFIGGIGMVIHHSSAAISLAALLSHVLPPTREVLAVTLPLLMQHWGILLKYNYNLAYVVIEVVLEVWFEWNAFSCIENLHELHWMGGVMVASMLFAHWCYFLSGAINLAFNRESEEATYHNDTVKRMTDTARSMRHIETFNHKKNDEEKGAEEDDFVENAPLRIK